MNKICTSIEQSKKLAEILPLESADMTWEQVTKDLAEDFTWKPTIGLNEGIKGNLFSYRNGYISPCWSLTALLDVLPIVYTNNKKEVCGPLHIDITDSETPFVLWYVNPLHKGDIVELKTNEYNNLVDACYEMILKLKENNNLL